MDARFHLDLITTNLESSINHEGYDRLSSLLAAKARLELLINITAQEAQRSNLTPVSLNGGR